MSAWGFCKDEFQDTGGFPHQLYVREARRMLGEYVMTEKNCRWEEKPDDSVGLGAYNMDSHNCRRLVRDGHGATMKATCRSASKAPIRSPIARSFRRPRECENLLVPVCLSATHIAYGSIRMEPVFMIMGESAATAASLAIDAAVSVRRSITRSCASSSWLDGQVLAWTGPSAPTGASRRKS